MEQKKRIQKNIKYVQRIFKKILPNMNKSDIIMTQKQI